MSAWRSGSDFTVASGQWVYFLVDSTCLQRTHARSGQGCRNQETHPRQPVNRGHQSDSVSTNARIDRVASAKSRIGPRVETTSATEIQIFIAQLITFAGVSLPH